MQSAAGMGKSSEDLEVEARIRGHIRQQMKERGINQAELARRIGTTEATASRILSGHRGIGVGMALKIARGLHITPSRLLEEDAPAEFADEHFLRNSKKR